MNSKIVLAVMIFSSVTLSYAQITLGIKAGININDIRSKNVPDWFTDKPESTTGFHLGVFSKFKLKGKFSIIPELQFIQKGYTFKGNPSQGTQAVETKIGYVEMPIVFYYCPIKYVGIDIGPSIAAKISVNTEPEVKGVDPDELNKPIDFGITSGVRLNLTERLSILGRYYYGISTVFKIFFVSPSGEGITATSHNKNFQISASYIIR